MNDFINGGYLKDKKTYIVSSVGIVSAIGAYLIGEEDIFTMMQTIFMLGGIYFLKQESSNQRKK